jgi:hypothetical protein
MRTALRSNAQPRSSPSYFIDVDLGQSTVRPQYVTVSVHQSSPSPASHDSWRRRFHADIAGFRLEAGNIHHIEHMVCELLPALINYARLPDYVFIARCSQRVYPVYTFGDEVIATTPGGPTFRHVELAKVRAYLNDYAHATGELGAPGKSDKLHVRGVSRHTLALLRPVFYLKKRVPNQTEFWAPVFEAEDGRSIYAYVASAKREVPKDRGREILALRHICAEALIADGRLLQSHDLRVDRLMAGYWADMRVMLKPEPYGLAVGQTANNSGVEMPLYRNGRMLVAVENRREEERWGLFFGEEPEDLRHRVARDYLRRCLIDSLEAVRIVAANTASPEVNMALVTDRGLVD